MLSDIDFSSSLGSPFTAKVIDASNAENQSIGKTDDTMTNSVESFSTINESTISEEDAQSINNSTNGGECKVLPIIASIQTPSGKLIEGVHWIRVGNTQRVVRYNQSLLIDFLQNQQNPLAHERAIEAYLASLPSHKPRKRSRANKS